MRLAERAVEIRPQKEAVGVLFAGGSGPYVTDTSGRTYVDFVLGYGPVVLGHGDPEFVELVGRSLAHGIQFPGMSAFHQSYIDLVFGDGFESGAAGIFKTSSEAVLAAMRIAAARTGKNGIVRCGFIGWHDAEIQNSVFWHEGLATQRRYHVRTIPGASEARPETARLRNWVDLDLSSLDETLSRPDVGVAVIDVYQDDLAPRPILAEFIALCKRRGVCSVLDETKTAGRVDAQGVFCIDGLDADFVVTGKAIANGAPLSVLLLREYDAREYSSVRVGGTHSKDVLSIACGIATHTVMNRREGYEALRGEAYRVCRIINAAAADTGMADVVAATQRMRGTAFELVVDEARIGDSRDDLRARLANSGVLLLVGHPSFVSLAHSHVPELALYESVSNAFKDHVSIRS